MKASFFNIILLISILSGCDQDVETKQPAVDKAILSKYEGKIIKQPAAGRSKEDGWFLVLNGKKRWIIDGSWLDANGFKPEDVIEIPSSDFNGIPEDPDPIRFVK